MRRFFLNIVVATAVVMLMATQVAFAQVPAAANHFRPDLVRAAQAVWGIRAPIPMFSGQIHQESMWRPDVCSPYACGLTQFTPGTADWIAQTYGVELETTDARQARFHPVWAMRAMVRYDKHLYDRSKGHTECDRMWAVLRHYNGGAGHWFKEAANAADPLDRDSVDAQCGTARRSIKHCPENLRYPRAILHTHQKNYLTWGRMICESPG